MQILIFRGDIHVNGNGRDTYKFRAIHPNTQNVSAVHQGVQVIFSLSSMSLSNCSDTPSGQPGDQSDCVGRGKVKLSDMNTGTTK